MLDDGIQHAIKCAARYCKSIGLKVVYYFPPGTWRRTGTQGADLAAVTDEVIVPYPWAEERYRALGANVVNVGHPMLERVRSEFRLDVHHSR